MHLDQVLGSRSAVQTIHVLGDQREPATSTSNLLFEGRQSEVRSVGLGRPTAIETLQVPLPRLHGIAVEEPQRAHLQHVVGPHRIGV